MTAQVDSLSRRFLASMVYIISPISLRLQTNTAEDFTVEGSIVRIAYKLKYANNILMSKEVQLKSISPIPLAEQ